MNGNSVHLVGYIATHIEQEILRNELLCAKFKLAIKTKVYGKPEEVNAKYIPISAYGTKAEKLLEQCSLSELVVCSGHLTVGVSRGVEMVKVILDDIEPLYRKEEFYEIK